MAESAPVLRRQDERRYRPLVHVLVRRRRLRADLLQAISILVGISLGLAMAQLTAEPSVDARISAQLLTGIAAGILPFVGLVYSLLFLVVQFGSTNLTPRLNLFRDNPIVWRAFSYFIGLMVWAGTAALAISGKDRVSVILPATALLGVLVALLLFRTLQVAAFSSIQLAPTLRDISDHGRAVIDALYTEPYAGPPDESTALPSARAEIRWERGGGILRQIDLPALVRAAVEVDGVIELMVTPGDAIREGAVVAQVRGGDGHVDGDALVASFDVGLERTFDQDPRFAFRLFADVAVRALSAAVNDQATTVQVIDSIDGLLTPLSTRRLDVGRIHAADGRLQVLISVPSWEEYIESAIADIARAGGHVVPVSQRLLRLLDDLGEAVHPSRQAPIDRWRSWLLSQRGPED